LSPFYFIMAKDPALLFYTSDFLSGTFTMSDEQVGKYIRLLCFHHQKADYLTEQDMLSICKAYDEQIWNKFQKQDGKYFNNRLMIETKRRNNYTESRRKNANSVKNENESAENEAHATAYAKHMETVTETITETIILNVFNNASQEFQKLWDEWKTYKAKEHKFKYKSERSERSSLKELHEMSMGDEVVATHIIEQSIANGWKGFFYIKNKSNNGQAITANNKSRGIDQLLNKARVEYNNKPK